MSEHRRKPPQPQGGGRAAARRGQSGSSSGRRAAPRGATGSPADSYGSDSGGSGGEERPYTGRADARRTAQRSGRRRAADNAGQGGRRGGPGGPPGPGRGRGRAGQEPAKKRFIDYPRSGKYGWRRWTPSWKLVTGLFIGFVGSMVALVGVGFAMVQIPDENLAAKSQNNVYYWADHTRMVATGTGVNRQNVNIDQIPPAMRYAVISAENKSFYQDSGIDPMGIARAVLNMARGGQTQGGSTITQQYVKNTYLSQDQTITRKFKELFISIKVGTKLKKDQILQGYLNTSYFGRGAYGIQAAAQTYYGKNAVDLKPSECAVLAALLKGPTYYDPAGAVDLDRSATRQANYQRSHDRWAWILGEMHKDKHLTDAEYQKAIKKYPMPQGRKATKGMTGQISYLVDTAKKYVLSHSNITEAQFDQGGYQVYTTFQKDKVDALNAAVKKIEKARIDPKKPKDKYVQFGAASVVPNDGAIVAIYGGAGYEHGYFSNNANTSGVPVGSTWKPFDLAAAMEYGTYWSDGVGLSPMSKYNGDDLIKIKKPDGSYYLNKDNTVFRQKNEGPKAWGYITLRKAMEQSINSPFVQLSVDVGLSKVRNVAKSAGILDQSMPKYPDPSFAIGTSTPSAIRMADAYATFAAQGRHTDPYSVTSVTHGGENLPGFAKPKPNRVMPANVANNVTDVLENVIQNGTAQNAKAIGRTAAGKTGTTDKNKSAWFVGYTQQLSTAVTMFRENPKKSGLISMYGTAGVDSIHGGDIPTLVWTDYMKVALKGKSDPGFPEATDIGEAQDEPGAPSPTPTVSITPSETPSETPSPTPSETVITPSPTPSQTCQWGWGSNCNGNGNSNGNGGGGLGGVGAGGATGDASPTPTGTDTTTASTTRGNGNGGGILSGPTG
ncbi:MULTISPECIES: transglycosylase domain-containing protein [unclassified Streptomyces]|uniref:transglycosylase domain-containing protein n=1 Tax=unclassified Streptomyces TaxID=2593676 RepID=UPI00099D89E9|nr:MULTISPECIES: transglycosylase domain-containing protein [unclassified Streptomyces]MCH0557019.1 transglycosylase domain-containing protein [Streptomyces sp. MUM 16J]